MQKLVEERLKNLSNYPKTVGPRSIKISDVQTGTWRMHRPVIDAEKCIMCGICQRNCPCGAIEPVHGKMNIDYYYCKGCGICFEECPKDAISFPLESEISIKEE
ncbi:MAG: 4Fe-4S binding protein [Peptoniphilaceae bacterium]|nr:4Fe-4S binding protein [Peptoniphilaceae bacterium]